MSNKIKAHNAFIMTTDRRPYGDSHCQIGINNGSRGIGMWMKQVGEYAGMTASLTPAQAREIARDLIERADELDPEGAASVPTVVLRNGEAYHGDNVDVIDLDFMGQTGAGPRSEMDQGDIDTIVERLRAAGFDAAADDVIEWWTA